MAAPSANVAARLGLQGRYTERSFHLRDFATTVHALEPERLDLGFHLSRGGDATLVIACEFDPGRGPAADEQVRAQLFKENLLRADRAGRFDCLFVEDPGLVFPEMQELSVLLPDGAELPGGQWLALPLPLLGAGVDVFQHALANGLEVGYRIELIRRPGDAALARRLAPALADLSTRGRHPEIEGAVRDAIDVVKDDGWWAHESFVLPLDAVNRAWLENLLQRRLKEARPFLAGSWELQWDEAPPEGDAADVQQTREPGYPDLVLDTIVPSQPDSPLPLASSPPAPAVAGNYVFMSYAHKNRDFCLRLIDLLEKSGARVWWDAGIESGTVWDEELERRIREAGAIVVCLTAQYEQSRICTRELKFADTKEKPILPIAPDPRGWSEGLELMFQEYQVASFGDGKGFPAFLHALQTKAPGVFADVPQGAPRGLM